MTNFQVDAIEIENAPVTWQGAATPCFKLFRQRVIEPTDGTGAGRDSHEGVSDFSHGCRVLVPVTNIWVKPSATCSSYRLERSKSWVWNSPARSSSHFQVLDLTRGSCQITGVAPVAVSFPVGATLSPLCSQKLGQFFAHDGFHHHLHGTT